MSPRSGAERSCAACGAAFRGWTKVQTFCSRACWALKPTTQWPTLERRFWAKVEKTETCWLWTGRLDKLGYGDIRAHGRRQRAHRVSWQFAHGAIPDGMFVCHRCDTPPCVNPAHLFVGSAADNNRDMAAKGRNHNQRKTHCEVGHPLTRDNLVPRRDARRECLTCKRERGVGRAAYCREHRQRQGAQ